MWTVKADGRLGNGSPAEVASSGGGGGEDPRMISLEAEESESRARSATLLSRTGGGIIMDAAQARLYHPASPIASRSDACMRN